MRKIKSILALALALVLLSTTAAWADNPYAKYRDGDSQTEATAEPTEAPAVDPTEAPAAESESPAAEPEEAAAEEADVDESDGVEAPDESELLETVVETYIHASDGKFVKTYTAPDGEEYSELQDSAPVAVIAERGKYSCVAAPGDNYDDTENLYYYGWVETKYLDDNYYGELDGDSSSMRKDLESWSNIESIVPADGTIVGIKNDGTTVSTGSLDFSNWGKLTALYSEYGYSTGMVFGLLADGGIKTHQRSYSFYPRRDKIDGYWSEEAQEKFDPDFLDFHYADAKDAIGGTDYGCMLLMKDGTLRQLEMMTGAVYKAGEAGFNSVAYTENGVWYYLTYSEDHWYLYTEKDGEFDLENGRDVTGDKNYSIENIAKGIIDIKGKWPGISFTAIKANGDVVRGSDNSSFSENFAYDFTGLSALIDEYSGIKDGKIVSLEDGIAYNFLQYPEVAEWSNLTYVEVSNQAIAAIDAAGNVYGYYIGDDSEADGKLDFTDWKNVKSVVLVEDWYTGNFATLGVTKDGKVLISGTLPDETAQ